MANARGPSCADKAESIRSVNGKKARWNIREADANLAPRRAVISDGVKVGRFCLGNGRRCRSSCCASWPAALLACLAQEMFDLLPQASPLPLLLFGELGQRGRIAHAGQVGILLPLT